MVKKAISIWSFSGKTIRESMTLAKAAGFDGIELALNEDGELSLNAQHDELTAIRSYADEIALPVHSLATGLFWRYSFTSNDEETRKKAVQIAETQLRTAKILGSDSILIVPGLVTADVSYDKAYDRAFAAVKSLAPIATELQIHIGIENVWNKFLLSPLETRNFIDAVGSPYVGAYFDVGNILYNGYPEQWIRILNTRIKKLHIKDYKNAAAGSGSFVDLLSGDVDWPAVTDALRDVGYDNWVTAEITPAYKHYPEQTIWNTAASMNRILSY